MIKVREKQKTKVHYFIVLVLMFAMILISTFCTLFAFKLQKAEALTGDGFGGAYKIGANGDGSTLSEIYDSQKSEFNEAYIKELLSKLIGKNNASIRDVKNYIKTNGVEEFDSKVVKATQINVNVGNAQYGILIKMRGVDYMITSLTLDTSEKENVVLTLYQAENDSDIGQIQYFPSIGHDTDTDTPSNMYSSSTIRSTVKSMPTVAQKYLVLPKDIAYQHKQTDKGIKGYTLPNEALDNVSGYSDSSINYYQKPGYADWGNDYVWLPSSTEVGGAGVQSKSIWALSDEQLKHNQLHSWLRSGHKTTYYFAATIRGEDGTANGSYVHDSYGVRVALHLNLTECAQTICEHNWDEGTVTKSPTCTEKGKCLFKCTFCELEVEREIDATDHTIVAIDGKEPTCTQEGLTDGQKCSVCNAVIAQQVTIQKLPHTEVIIPAAEATCTQDGTSEGRYCTVCNTITKEQTTIKATGHSEVTDLAIEATCTQDGKTLGKHCSECDTILVEQVVIPAKGHTEVIDNAIPATCTENGKSKGKHCSVCDTVIVEQTVIVAMGHNYVKGETVDPTPNSAGYTVYTCANCGDSHHDDIIPALGHDYQVSKVTPPTCTENGYTTYVCSDCGDSYDADYVNALGHDYQSHIIAPDCESDGYTRYTCLRCDDYYDENIIPAFGHDYGDAVWEWASNFFKATAIFYCSHGDEHTVRIPAKIDEEKTTATCTQKGDAVFIGEVTFNGIIYTDTQSVSGTTIPHICEVTWTWNDDNTVSADVKCTSCVTPFEPEISVVYDEDSKSYTATFELDGITYSDVKTVDTEPKPNDTTPNEKNEDNKVVDFGMVSEILKEWWQVVASAVSIILIIIFMSKGIGYAQKKKQAKSTMTRKYNVSYYAGATGLFGLAMTSWTVIACVLMVLAVLSMVFMIVSKRGYVKAIRQLEDAKDEYEKAQAQKRDDDMRMMFMGMLGGNNGQQGYAYVSQPSFGLEDMRGMINEAVTATLPNVQQYLPQQASDNNDLVEKILEKTAKNEETIQKLMKKIAEQSTEKIVETVIAREVAGANANDETMKQILRNQELLMEQIKELSEKQNIEPQIIEKVVEKEVKVEVPVEVEKIVEKEVVKEVPIEVEKIVEKEVRIEVPVEKVVEKAVVEKETTPRLTLEDAYAKLSKQQQKYFDGLKEYAMSKDCKCKEKASTYFTTIGTSTTNPLVKLTIKKNQTVAMFKMEDEHMKDIRRNATSDGSKIKVKETELVVADAQSFKTAKEMIDLREDQIERYQDLLKEQRSMKNKR